jgi:uncharacterized membrane protein
MNDNRENNVVQTSGIISWITWLIVIASFFFQASCSRQTGHTAPSLAGSDVVVDVTALKQEVPQFFTYQYQGKNISFFVIKIDDHILSFLDACVTCYPYKQGYRYEDGVVVCRACNQRFPVYKLEKGIGNCYPIKIAGRIENGKYLIPRSSLEQESGKF